MSQIIKGNLAAYLCTDCSENLSQVKIRIYLPASEDQSEALAAAKIKDTFREVSDEEIKAKQNRLLAEAETDLQGNFAIKIDERYNRTALEIDFSCGTVPRLPLPPKKGKERQFHITTFMPQWQMTNDQQLMAEFSYIIPERWWCIIKGKYFDVWTICGKLTDCKTGKPLNGISVIAMDADFITDDELGRNTTDSAGHFKIHYSSADFKKTFLSPLINVETDVLPPFASGPDVYFHIEYNGQRFALETKANRRNNVGYCLCVKLCADDLVPVESTAPPSFTKIGLTQRIHIQSGIELSTGKAGGYAFFSSINLVGTIKKTINSQEMQYIFEFQEVANPSNPLVESAWNPVSPDMIDKTEIGYLYKYTGDPANPVSQDPYYINGTGTENKVEFNGNWIKVPQEDKFAVNVNGLILRLNTEKLTGVTSIDMAMPTSGIGNATVSAARPHTANRYFAIRMRQREGDSGATMVAGTSKPIAIYNVLYQNVNKYGSWAHATANNQRIALSVDLEEIISGSGGCSKITTDLHVKYGARNENMGTVNLSINGPSKPGQSFGFNPITLMAVPETYGSTQLVFTPPTDTVEDLLPCAYTVSISATALLTTGDSNLGTYSDFVSFCKV